MNRLLKTSIAIIFLGLLLSCSENEEIWTEDLSLEIPTLRLAEISESGFADVTMSGKSSIQGFTRNHYFSTNDLFKSYSKVNGGISFDDIVYRDKDLVTLFDYNGNNFELSIVDRTLSSNPTYSTRFTLTAWERVRINQYFYSGFIDYKMADFIARSQGWIAADYERSSNGPHQDQFPHGIRIYEVNGNSNRLISTIEGFRLETKDIDFDSRGGGYVLAYRSSERTGYLYETSDGGSSWTEVFSFEGVPEELLVLEGSNLLIEYDKGYLQSGNGGQSWTAIPSEKSILHTNVDNNGILYSLQLEDSDRYSAIGSLSTSSDNGLTWTQVSGEPFYGRKISFFDWGVKSFE